MMTFLIHITNFTYANLDNTIFRYYIKYAIKAIKAISKVVGSGMSHGHIVR